MSAVLFAIMAAVSSSISDGMLLNFDRSFLLIDSALAFEINGTIGTIASKSFGLLAINSR